MLQPENMGAEYRRNLETLSFGLYISVNCHLYSLVYKVSRTLIITLLHTVECVAWSYRHTQHTYWGLVSQLLSCLKPISAGDGWKTISFVSHPYNLSTSQCAFPRYINGNTVHFTALLKRVLKAHPIFLSEG